MLAGDDDTVSDVTDDDDVGSDVASDATGALEEGERFRRLFSVFDANQDGFLDKSDLERMCRQLELDEQAVPLILSQLGADDHGQVSCDDFMRAWLGLRAEVARLRQQPTDERPASADLHLTAAAEPDTLGDCVSWSSGVTSGDPADPTLQPDSLFILLEKAGHVTNEPSELLIAADKVHQVALAALRSELAVTSARLGQTTEENSQLQKTLSKTLRERTRCDREAAELLEQTVERYEQRLVELHSVIAELTRALQRQRSCAIAEEDEDELDNEQEDEETDELDGDESAAEGERDDGPSAADKACQMTDTSDDETRPHCVAHPAARPLSPAGAKRTLTSPALEPPRATPPSPRLELLQEEIYTLRKENSRLQEHVGRQEADMNRCRIASESVAEERDKMRRKLVEYTRLLDSPSPVRSRGSTAAPAGDQSAVVPRMAERVRLRPSRVGVTGSDISACGVQSTKVAEHLVQGYQGDSWSQESLHGSERCLQERLLLAELETQRLRARLDHAQAAADVTMLSLEATRAQADHLASLVGKYESNCVALQLAVEQSDQLTEAFDVLLALQDSELALLLASCRAAGIGLGLTSAGRPPTAEAETALRVASEQRRSCENVARHALSRLDRHERSATAYEDLDSHNTSTTSSSSSGVDVDVAKSDEARVRQHIQRLKVERALVVRTVVRLESTCHPAPEPRPLPPAALQRLDLEHAVLMQELMALREDRAELRSRLFLTEREKTGLELKLSSLAASERAHRLQLEQLRAEYAEQLAEAETEPPSGDTADSAGSGNSGSPSRREAAQRSRLRQLTAGLDELTRTSEMRQQHADEFIAELKRANGALADALDRTKRKYQAKLKRLEQQMLQIVERHSAQQPRSAKQKLASDKDAASEPTDPPAPSATATPTPEAPATSQPSTPPVTHTTPPVPGVTSSVSRMTSPVSPRMVPPVVSSRLPVMSPAHRTFSSPIQPATSPGSRVTSPALARFLSSPAPPPPPVTSRVSSPARSARPAPVRVPPPVPPPPPQCTKRAAPATVWPAVTGRP